MNVCTQGIFRSLLQNSEKRAPQFLQPRLQEPAPLLRLGAKRAQTWHMLHKGNLNYKVLYFQASRGTSK